MQVQLADDDRARSLQLPNQSGIFGRNSLAELIAGGGGANARGIEQVFQSDRNTVQRAAPVTGHDFGFGLARLVERQIAGDGDERVENRIQPLDTREALACKFNRREPAGANLFGGVGEGEHAKERLSVR